MDEHRLVGAVSNLCFPLFGVNPGGHFPAVPDANDRLRQLSDCFNIAGTDTGHRIFMGVVRAKGNGVAVRPAADHLQGHIDKMTVRIDQHADFDVIMPEGEVRMAGAEDHFGIEVGIDWPVVGHGDDPRPRDLLRH